MEVLILIFLIPVFWIVNKLLKRRAEKKANKEWDRWVKPYKDRPYDDSFLQGKGDNSVTGIKRWAI